MNGYNYRPKAFNQVHLLFTKQSLSIEKSAEQIHHSHSLETQILSHLKLNRKSNRKVFMYLEGRVGMAFLRTL